MPWPSVTRETYPWERDPDFLALVPKSRRKKIGSTYEASVPARIAELPVELPMDVLTRITEVEVALARFDQTQEARDFALPALLLRSESSSSSQIEHLTSSVRNVALAELSDKAPKNALLIANNVAAMRKALAHPGTLDLQTICDVHSTLMRGSGEREGLRAEQVWIGGTPYSPHGAQFVPPHPARVPQALDDLLAFSRREDVAAIAKAAIFHAQFETIHPFADGNGRTGRALLHRMLAADDVLRSMTLPLSAGLLHDVEPYMSALDAYHEGAIEPIVERLLDALELAVIIGSRVATEVGQVLETWRSKDADRAGSASHQLPALLVEQPVVDVAHVAQGLGVSDRAARSIVANACERGILHKMGNARRGAFYQATDLIDVLEEASSLPGIRRIATG